MITSLFVKGNLKLNEAKGRTTRVERFGGIEAEQDGEAWNITLTWRWKGGSCDVKTVITKSTKVEEVPTEITQDADLRVHSLNFEWIAEFGYWGIGKQDFANIEIDEDGAFSLIQFYAPDPSAFHADIKGNLRRNEAELDQDKSVTGGTKLSKIKAEQDGEAWNATINWRWSGGSCDVKTVITKR